jgi:hypothetical protein
MLKLRSLLAAAGGVSLAAALLSACGGGSGDARPLLREAFSHPVRSATVTVELRATLDGGPQAGPFDLQLSGPYRSNGARKIPSFAWALSVVGGRRSFEGALTSTGDDLYLTAGPRSFDLGAGRVAQANAQLRQGSGGALATLGIDPQRWVRDAHVAGRADVSSVPTTHVRASVDVARMLSDLNRAVGEAGGAVPTGLPRALTPAQIAAARQAIRDPALDVYVAKADGTLRRLAIAFAFQIPPADRARFGGLSGGSLSASVELADIGRPVSVTAPQNPQPLGPPAQGGGQVGSGKLAAYGRCLQRAGADAAAVERCAALLK